ncbi:hypothetical protein LIER_10991 [Lithospermum erythrorhizon]|uniref:Reverse transcriptase domain-containing protein n=1 Tax=Lithospermum erythrorhizon TaxID=34254 RepID=A0AAV3PMX7_LITER
MLKATEGRKVLTKIKVGSNSPQINHILFADDTMLFCKASVSESTGVMQILRDYERASGQKVNVNKCSVIFEARTPEGLRQRIQQVMGMREVKDQGKYLGLPS